MRQTLSFFKQKAIAVFCVLLIFIDMMGHDQLAYSFDFKIQPVIAASSMSLLGMTIYPNQPLRLDFIVDSGSKHIDNNELNQESQKLVNYFLAAFTVPADQMWVNLSPYEKNYVIPQGLGRTEMGRDLLAQDYVLKQITSSLMNPQQEIGQKFWHDIYQRASRLLGHTDIRVQSFNKVWILPDKAEVFMQGHTVFIQNMHMKIMLDQDYLAQKKHGQYQDTDTQDAMHKIILPQIEREVNGAPDFINLRQMVEALILASWYKKHIQESIMAKVYANQNKTRGIDLKDPRQIEKIYEQYVQLFKRGTYNFIKEDFDPITQKMIPRKYFAGGFQAGVASNPAMVPQGALPRLKGDKLRVVVDMSMVPEPAYEDEFISHNPVNIAFTDSRVHSMDELKPGEIMINAGRENKIEVVDGKVKAIKDHHHLGNDPTVPRSASALIWRDAQQLRSAGPIDTVITNYDPDFDTIVAIMMIDLMRQHENAPR